MQYDGVRGGGRKLLKKGMIISKVNIYSCLANWQFISATIKHKFKKIEVYDEM